MTGIYDESDSGHDLDALDFGESQVVDVPSDLDVLAEVYTPEETGYDRAGCDDTELDAIPDSVPAPVPKQDDWDVLSGPEEADEEVVPVIQAMNTPGTVACAVFLSGTVSHVSLDSSVSSLDEAQLAEEIRVVADVATKKASALLHINVVETLVEQGWNLREAREFVEANVPFSTPQQAYEAELALDARHSEHQG
ncbi:hypothetical protein A5792_23935 [Mycolicibacterium peregrinum]|uniref:ESX-1 secretion-associated protein EspH n=1 Tax=Mycolicibacterium peregrinum TaxID=43304 RepID=A0A1A0QXI5_MYCPR|nr:hypothetical protein [Mycolicibacterium peregrinum]OBB26910.1 hypothetical protein A5792_23935 [Mycolicibacterium peregrinum]